jgi:hypothetical protein
MTFVVFTGVNIKIQFSGMLRHTTEDCNIIIIIINFVCYVPTISQWLQCTICSFSVVVVQTKRCLFNPLKTKHICFIYGLSAYRAINARHFGYKNQSFDVL